jgi:FKBP12-rapamycin complex-associated protein
MGPCNALVLPPLPGHSLIQFLRDCVVSYLEDENPAIRKEAALTCARLLLRTHGADGIMDDDTAMVAFVCFCIPCIVYVALCGRYRSFDAHLIATAPAAAFV